MKESEVDKELTRVIKDTLHNYKTDYIEGAWEDFVSKKSERRKIILWGWTSGIAASLLLGIIGLGIWLSSDNVHGPLNKGISINNEKPKNETNISKSSGTDISENSIMNIKDEIANTRDKDFDNKGVTGEGKSTNSTIKSDFNNNGSTITMINEKREAVYIPELVISDTIGEGINDNSLMLSSFEVQMASSPDSVRKDNFENIETLSISYQDTLAEDVFSEPSRKITLGVIFSPMLSATTSNSTINFAGGMSADYEVSSNLSLSTGLQLEHQNVSFSDYRTPESGPSESLEAEFYGLDIPLNLSFNFIKEKERSYYVTSGLSSVVFLSQNYTTTTYSQNIKEVSLQTDGQQLFSYSTVNEQETTKESVDSFQKFDFLGRLNLSLGMKQQLSEKLAFHVEPYVKIPFSGLGSENLKFTTGGINCRLSF